MIDNAITYPRPSLLCLSLYLWIEMRYLFPMVIVGMGSMRDWWGWLSGCATACKCKVSYLMVIYQIISNQGHSLSKETKKKYIKMATKKLVICFLVAANILIPLGNQLGGQNVTEKSSSLQYEGNIAFALSSGRGI